MPVASAISSNSHKSYENHCSSCRSSPRLALGALPALAQDQIKVGEFASLTGGSASFGQSSHNGTALAIDEINAAGGVLGKKFELHHGGRPVDGRRALDHRAQADLRGQSGRGARRGGLVEVARGGADLPGEQDPDDLAGLDQSRRSREVGDYIFRVCFIDPFQGKVMAKFALSKGWKNVALLTDVKQDYSVGLAEVFKESFTAGGGDDRQRPEIQHRRQGFQGAAHLDQGGAPGCDLRARLLRRGGADRAAGAAARDQGAAARRRRLGGRVAAEGGGAGAGRVVFLEPLLAGRSLAGDPGFREDVPGEVSARSRTPWRRWATTRAKILADAIKRAGTTDGPKLRDAIAATKDFKGVTGDITLDAHRNATKAAVILTIANGGFQFVQRVAP